MCVRLKAVKISDVICISTLLPNVVSNFHAPQICLGNVVLVDLIYPFLVEPFLFFFSRVFILYGKDVTCCYLLLY